MLSSKNTHQLKHIDSLRGIAILMVILVHTAQGVNFTQQHEPLSTLVMSLTNYGQVGVQLFFIISAYTLCLSLSKRQQETLKLSKFFIRRFFRIAPMYYAGIVFYALTYSLFNWLKTGLIQLPDYYTWLNVASNVFFVHGFYPPANSNIVLGGWSIGTEMAFYLIFPCLFMMANQLTKISAGFILTFILSFIIADYFLVRYLAEASLKPLLNNSFWFYHLSNQLPVFCLGIALFFLEKTSGLKIQSPLLDSLFFLLFTVLALSVWHSTYFMAFFWLPLISGLSFVFLYRLFANLEGLNIQLLQKIGQRSFSMYIFHFVFSYQVSGLLCRYLNDYLSTNILLTLCYCFTIVATFILANLSYHYLEKSGITLGRSLIQRIS